MSRNSADEWIRTDRDAVVQDHDRLGLDGCIDYQMSLIADRAAAGDDRWDEITYEEMKRAVEDAVSCAALEP